MTSLYFQLESGDYKFYLTIHKGKGSDTLSIGGRKGECVNISVNTPESPLVQRGYHKLDTATIPILAWDTKCAVNKNLEKGSGTIAMIRLILSECVKRYSYIKYYTFKDNSLIPCDNGQKISLLHLTIIKYNKSWYEQHFNAYIEEPSYRKKYKDGITVLNDPLLKMSFEEFKNILPRLSKEFEIDLLKSHYEKTETYFLFFKSILDTEGKNRQCNLLVGWIDIFLLYIFQFDPLSVPWVIDSESVIIQEVSEIKLEKKPLQTGGKRYTRRNIPNVMRVNINDSADI
jgi:hypothetical protein